jgi:endonuclease-3
MPKTKKTKKYSETTKKQKAYAGKVLRRLKKGYPEATCSLNYDSPLQLLVATILSAQCTDVRVNEVTPTLFKKYGTAKDFAEASLPELERVIQSTGFFRNKAKNIRECCRILTEKHGGEIPGEMETLVRLPGVGRKTANCVLGTAMGVSSGVVVDTHVKRLSQRLGLTQEKDPVKIENDLMALFPKREWIDLSHRLIHHGRAVCRSRRPDCEQCVLKDICPRIGVAP